MKPTPYHQKWPVRRFVILGLVTLVGLIAGFGSWAAFANLSGAIVVEGRLSEKRANQLIQHINGGVVSDVFISEGEYVSAKSPLIKLDDGPILSELKIVENRLFEIMARRNRLEAERDEAATITFDPELIFRSKMEGNVAKMIAGQSQLYAAGQILRAQSITALNKKNSQIQIQIEGIEAQLHALRTQLSLSRNLLTDQQALLDKGLGRTIAVVNLEQDIAVLQGKFGALVSEQAVAHTKATSADLEILQLKSKRREQAIVQLRDLALRQTELSENRRALLVRLENLTIRSPIEGVVLGLGAISEQTVINPAETLMRIAPQDRRYVIVSRIAPSQVDQIYPNQTVRLNFSTLDFGSRSEITGQVSLISADALTDKSTGAIYYRTEIVPSDNALAQLSMRQDIYPGMPVELYFRTGDQPAWHYFFEPLTRYFSRAFRES